MHMHVNTEDVLPFIPWLRRYNRHYLKADLFAGLTVAVVALPQSMAYAIIAGLPVEYGLYTSIVPTIIGCLWGSSAHFIWHQIGTLAPAALAITILGLMEAISISQSIADQTRQRLKVNREFIGQGLANLSAAFFSGYPCSGSFTRSAVNFRAGGRTPLSGIISGLAVGIAVLLAGPLTAKLPLCALSGVLIVVAYQLIRVADIRRALRATRSDAAVMLVTFLFTVFLNIEFSIYVGVLLSIGLHLAKTSHPRIYSVIPDLATGQMVGFAQGQTCCQMDILQIEGSIFFGSATFVIEDLQRRLRHHPRVSHLLIRMHQVNTLDASGIHILEIMVDQIRGRGGGIYFSGVNQRVFDVLNNSGLLNDIGHSHIHSTTGAVIRQAMRESFCPVICAACEATVFRECPDLKAGNWEIFGSGVRARECRLPRSEEQSNAETDQ